ncbi:hypothetical protein BJV78DRAFT_1178863 [Lactifluus subvellereus]|nr:hypothetical protein BJV78DRAFT_1178863 [Lactifluus subvellereus]
MMLYKPLVSLVAVLAAASSVAASVTPVARGNDYPPPNLAPVPASQCNTQSLQCCNTFTSTSNPLTGLLSGLLGLGALLDASLGVGLSCLSIIGGTQCNNSPVCCTNVSQNGLINLGCSPVNINL